MICMAEERDAPCLWWWALKKWLLRFAWVSSQADRCPLHSFPSSLYYCDARRRGTELVPLPMKDWNVWLFDDCPPWHYSGGESKWDVRGEWASAGRPRWSSCCGQQQQLVLPWSAYSDCHCLQRTVNFRTRTYHHLPLLLVLRLILLSLTSATETFVLAVHHFHFDETFCRVLHLLLLPFHFCFSLPVQSMTWFYRKKK